MFAPRPSRHGFSLIELLVVVAIAAILALIAFPSYMNHVQKTRRADGQIALGDLALRLERCYTQFGAYDAAGCAIASPYDSPEGYYSIAVQARDATTYALTATPVGAQANDTSCGALTLNQLGQRGADGGSPDECW